jgi:hypothetical protein
LLAFCCAPKELRPSFIEGVTAPVVDIVLAEAGDHGASASAALHDLVAAGVLAEHGTVQPAGPGRPRRLYTSPELLGLAGSNPLEDEGRDHD